MDYELAISTSVPMQNLRSKDVVEVMFFLDGSKWVPAPLNDEAEKDKMYEKFLKGEYKKCESMFIPMEKSK